MTKRSCFSQAQKIRQNQIHFEKMLTGVQGFHAIRQWCNKKLNIDEESDEKDAEEMPELVHLIDLKQESIYDSDLGEIS